MMANNSENIRIYGLTGEVGRDGLLTQEQYAHLHSIQVAAAASCMDYLDQKRPTDPFPLVAMATGIGKGKIIHHVIESQIKKKPDSKILVIAGTKLVLVDQTNAALGDHQSGTYEVPLFEEDVYDELGDIEDFDDAYDVLNDQPEIEEVLAEEDSFLYKTGKIGDEDANVHVAVIQKLQAEIRLQAMDPKEYDLVIVDEVHNIGTEKRKATIHEFDRVVGFTATPYRSYGDMKTPEEYGFSSISPLHLKEAQDLGFLPPLIGMQFDTSSVIEEIPMIQDREGKIHYGKLERALKGSPDLRPYIADRVTEMIGGDYRYKTMIVVNFIWEAQELAELLKERGISVGIAVGRQYSSRIHTDEIPVIDSIERYKLPQEDENSIQVLISPHVAAEGFDAPFTEVLVWASPTDSALRYTQYVGRLTRRAEGKQFGILIDFLYQTSQYNWSYNFGMWMKGDLEQLDNGLLWLGPVGSIDEIKNLPEIERLLNKSAKEPLSTLQLGKFLPLGDTDFSLANSNIRRVFSGVAKKNEEIAWSVARELQARDPALVTKRIGKQNRICDAVTDRTLFLRLIEARGVKLKEVDLQEVQPTDILLTQTTIPELLVGDPSDIRPVLRKVLTELKVNNPGSVARRKSGNHFVNVVLPEGEELFYKTMAANGIRRRDLEMQQMKDLQPGEFVVGQENLTSLFYGRWSKTSELASDILEYFRAVLPDIVEKRMSGTRIVNIVHDPFFFVGLMVFFGAKLKNSELQSIKPGDFPLRHKDLRAKYYGDSSGKLKQAKEEILNEAADNGLNVTELRRTLDGEVTVIPEERSEWFEGEMVKRGVRLREISTTENSEVEEVLAEVDPEYIEDTGSEEDAYDFEITPVPDASTVLSTLQESAHTLREVGIEIPADREHSLFGELLSEPHGPFELQQRRMSEYHRHIFSSDDHLRVDNFIDGHEGNLTLKQVLDLTGHRGSLQVRVLIRRFVNENSADATDLPENIFRDLVAIIGFSAEN